MIVHSYTVSGLDGQSADIIGRNPPAGDAWEQNGQVCHTQDDAVFNMISKALTVFLPVKLERKITTCNETVQLVRVVGPSVREKLAALALEQGTTVRAEDLAAAGQVREGLLVSLQRPALGGLRAALQRPAPVAADLAALRLAIAE